MDFVSYNRSISSEEHVLSPETVWHFQMPEVRFGIGAREEAGYQLREMGIDPNAPGLIITDEGLMKTGHPREIQSLLQNDGFQVDIYGESEREPSVESIEQCLNWIQDQQRAEGYDFYVGIGGGSSMDTAKTVRAVMESGGRVIDYIAEPTGNDKSLEQPETPLITMPTTAGTGAEISQVAVLSLPEHEIKEAISSEHLLADAAVIDPALTQTLPADLTAQTGMDALGHAMEGFLTTSHDEWLKPEAPDSRPVYSGRTPLTELFTEKAIRLLSSSIRRAVNNGDDLEARKNMSLGAFFGALGGLNAGAGLCHAIAYPVGNRYHTYHGETIAVLTPASTLGYNASAYPERTAKIAKILGVNTDSMSTRDAADAAKTAYIQLQKDLNVLPSGLYELAGVTKDELNWIAEQTVETQQRLMRNNPRPASVDDVHDVLHESLHNW